MKMFHPGLIVRIWLLRTIKFLYLESLTLVAALKHNPTFLLDTPDIKRLGRYVLELKQHREDKLQSVNHNHFNNHQHVTNINFQEQGETVNVDTPTPLGLSLDEAEMQISTKHLNVE